jgi:hypothetical protein
VVAHSEGASGTVALMEAAAAASLEVPARLLVAPAVGEASSMEQQAALIVPPTVSIASVPMDHGSYIKEILVVLRLSWFIHKTDHCCAEIIMSLNCILGCIIWFVWQGIDWDSIQIEQRWDEEGTQQISVEDGVYEKLGLKKEDERAEKARGEADSSASGVLRSNVPADLDCGDVLSKEVLSLCDWKNPVMKLGCRYKDMPTFRLAMRQFAIKNEFELGIESTCS